MSKPSSIEEKRENSPSTDDFIKQRWIFVHELRSMLDEFEDDDWVVVNKVGNINVYDEGGSKFATIDMLWGQINRWYKEDG